MWLGQDEGVQGLGCPGSTCMGADGHLYEWVEGVDGLGNPVGFWKKLKRGLRSVARRVAPLVPLIPGGAAVAALTAAAPYLRRAAPVLQRVAQVAPGVIPAALTAVVSPPSVPAPEGGTAGWGLGDIAQGSDGNLYQWVQGVDGLGNPVGFWKKLKRRLKSVAKRALPLARQLAPFVPGGAAALTVATPFLKQAGVAGYDGFAADDELRGLSQEELRGIAADDELSEWGDDVEGFDDDGDIQGFEDDGDIQGFEDDDLRGFADNEVNGLSAEEMQGFADDTDGVDGYIRQDGVSGLEAYLPDTPRETPWFKPPAAAPPLWSPLW